MALPMRTLRGHWRRHTSQGRLSQAIFTGRKERSKRNKPIAMSTLHRGSSGTKMQINRPSKVAAGVD
jgi:hypothetical protein